MARLITAAERITLARKLIENARQVPLPQEQGWADFSYTAKVKDLLRQARDMIKFIGYTTGLSAETKAEAKIVAGEIDQAESDLLHRNSI